MKKITSEQYLTILGCVTLLLQQRQTLDRMEAQCASLLKSMGAEDEQREGGRVGMEVRDWVGEAVYNQGDDPESAAKGLLSALGIEVKS